jgi:hypothetical protein
MRFAAAAFAVSAIFLAGVLVGIGSGDSADEAPVAIALVDEASPSPPSSEGKGSMGDEDVPRQVGHGEAGDEGGGGNAWYEDEVEDEDEGGDDDNSGPGSDDSGSGSDDSGSGSDDSGSGSDNSGSGSDNSGSGSGDSGSGSDSSGSGSSGSGGGGSSGPG